MKTAMKYLFKIILSSNIFKKINAYRGKIIFLFEPQQLYFYLSLLYGGINYLNFYKTVRNSVIKLKTQIFENIS